MKTKLTLALLALTTLFAACDKDDKNNPTPPERLLPMEGAYNVRDLGGYEAADGKTVKWRRAIRSGDLNLLTESDLDYLADTRIGVIVDFRGDGEVTAAPDKTPSTWRETRRFPIDAGNVFGLGAIETVEDGRQVMMAMNRYFVEECQEQYKGFFAVLQNEASAPLLFHCSAGKDRAGLASALFLASLGVDRETILADYMLSAEYVKDKYAAAVEQNPAMAPVMTTEPEFLQAAFEVIDEEYGGMESFLEEQLNVDLDKMRQLYTE